MIETKKYKEKQKKKMARGKVEPRRQRNKGCPRY